MGENISTTSGRGRKRGTPICIIFGAGQENCGCKCTHCTHKFGALDYPFSNSPSLMSIKSSVQTPVILMKLSGFCLVYHFVFCPIFLFYPISVRFFFLIWDGLSQSYSSVQIYLDFVFTDLQKCRNCIMVIQFPSIILLSLLY